LLLLHLTGPEARRNSSLYSTAQCRSQAALLFALAAKIVRMSPVLNKLVMIRDTIKQLTDPELGTVYTALSAEASTAYGLSAAFIVHDELGQVRGPSSELYEALETSTGAQENPLSIVISTQAPTDGDLLSVLIDDALAGHDPRTIVSLYAADPALDPFTEATIRKANPAFGDFQSADEVMMQAALAKRMPAREAGFRNLVLNQRTARNNPFVAKSVWDLNQDAVAVDWADAEVYGGLDLSTSKDLTALVLIAKIAGFWQVRPTFWLPEHNIEQRSKAERVPYDLWASQGLINLTPGKTVEYDFVAHELRELFNVLNIKKIAFDRWNFKHLRRELVDEGFSDEEITEKFFEFGQGFQSMSPAIRALEGDLLNAKLRHGAHPVLTMCAKNAVVQSDPANNRKLAKDKSAGRIDGMVALVMARGMAAIAEPEAEPEYQMMVL